jgi:hypothetical protein
MVLGEWLRTASDFEKEDVFLNVGCEIAKGQDLRDAFARDTDAAASVARALQGAGFDGRLKVVGKCEHARGVRRAGSNACMPFPYRLPGEPHPPSNLGSEARNDD